MAAWDQRPRPARGQRSLRSGQGALTSQKFWASQRSFHAWEGVWEGLGGGASIPEQLGIRGPAFLDKHMRVPIEANYRTTLELRTHNIPLFTRQCSSCYHGGDKVGNVREFLSPMDVFCNTLDDSMHSDAGEKTAKEVPMLGLGLASSHA